jgi:arylsulfatase A-like enzyme
MQEKLTRRDFLKLFRLLPFMFLSSELESKAKKLRRKTYGRNVLLIVFDAWSARNISLYGYHRKTTPNLLRLAERATVYHRHYSAGNFTTPGTGSLLTGTYPWTHRGLHVFGSLLQTFDSNNLFGLFPDHQRLAFSHNWLVDVILDRFRKELDVFHLPDEQAVYDGLVADGLFQNDYQASLIGDRAFFFIRNELPSSLFAHHGNRYFKRKKAARTNKKLAEAYPYGVPSFGENELLFLLEDAIDWSVEQINSLERPFLAYLHFLPPHGPYSPHKDFANLFVDGWKSPEKPLHFSAGKWSEEQIDREHLIYDRYIAFVDSEIGRMFRLLEERAIFSDTVIVLTSDHGEIFERGLLGHGSPAMYEPLIHIPLLIFEPGQSKRKDVFTVTNSVDILPTLLHIIGQEIPKWVEGEILPPYGKALEGRSVYVVEAQEGSQFRPLDRATFAAINGYHKLVYYKGYDGFDGVYEMYDLLNDPEELNNIYAHDHSIAKEMKADLLKKIKVGDAPYIK